MGKNKCTHENCSQRQVAFSEYCWEHTKSKDEYIKHLLSELSKGASFKDMNFSKVVLRNLDLSRADFEGANLSRSDISGANLFDANFKDSELLGANLSGSDLTGANLKGAELTKANLFGARLWHVNLQGANLDFSCFPLWCRSFNMKADDRLVFQLIAHICRLDKENLSNEAKDAITSLDNWRNTFCGYRWDVEEI